MKQWLGSLARIFVREPVQWPAIAAAVVQLASLSWPLTVAEQGALNAAVVAVAGLVAAWGVSAEKAAPFVTGLAQAVIACALAFGLQLDPQLQVSAMALVSYAASLYIRSQVVARGAVGGGRHEARP